MPRPCRARRKCRPMPTLKATPRLVEPKFEEDEGSDSEMVFSPFNQESPSRNIHYSQSLNFEGSSLKLRIRSEYFRPEPSLEEKENATVSPQCDFTSWPHRIATPAVDSDSKQLPGSSAGETSSNGVAKRGKKQTSVTDFFSPRRSSRKTTGAIAKEKECMIVQAVRDHCEEGLAVHMFPGKGRGVVALRDFAKGDFVVEYSGDLVDMKEAELREMKYARDKAAGCYMYYFEHQNRQLCVDATKETGRLGRLINHSRSRANLATKTLVIDGKPRLVLFATRDIRKDEEILYDYGDRRKQSLAHHPWLAS